MNALRFFGRRTIKVRCRGKIEISSLCFHRSFVNTYRKNSFDKLCYLNKFILIISSLVVKFKEKYKIKKQKKRKKTSLT
jgi:hypothetical protein